MNSNLIKQRLSALRQAMQSKGIDALIVPSADPHMSEYLPEYYKGRMYFSGFTGSAGTLVVGADFAYIWADSRYWLQGESELLGTGIELKKLMTGQPAYIDDLAQNLPQGSTVGIDGDVLSVAQSKALKQKFAQKDIQLVLMDVLGEVWQERPQLPNAPIYEHDGQFVDVSVSDKLTQVREQMTQKQADWHLISSLDDIAYLTNLRGADVECNPVFLAHMLIGHHKATLYVDQSKLSDEVRHFLTAANITTQDYQTIKDDLGQLSGTLLIDENKVAQGTLACLGDIKLIHATNPSTLAKAVKTDQQLAHIRQAMVQDGVALCEFFSTLEQRLAQGDIINEVDVDKMLGEARARQQYHIGASFESIVGFQEHGAIVHYSAKSDTCKTLQGDGLLLIDSGGQYQNGTTDITRMSFVGSVSDEAKRDVTYVLKAHIALATAVFPVGTPAPMLDMIARAPMWQVGLNYGHGTGHGVGYFLNVHEGPQSIAYTTPITNERTMLKGMVTSNEPGLYRAGQWGIRIENLVACVPAFDSEFGQFLKFEDLTLCPIDTRIILPQLLTECEKSWLNAYHQKVKAALIDHVDGEARTWLLQRCQAI